MKKLLFFIILTLLLQSCNKSEPINGGNFKSENNDFFYALNISSKKDSIKLYVLQEYSSFDSDVDIAERQNWKFYLEGRINIKEDEIELLELDSDILLSDRPKLKKLRIADGKIYADCENLSNYLFGKTTLGNCKTESIKFSRIEK